VAPPALTSSTLTHALRKASDAVDRVPKAKCEDAAGKRLRVDQRRSPRPGGKRCDSGAFERKG
jgi:hypothetical protein